MYNCNNLLKLDWPFSDRFEVLQGETELSSVSSVFSLSAMIICHCCAVLPRGKEG